jgi:hypothetical protein
MEMYAEAFDNAGALDKLEGFASFHGPDFYALPRNTGTITLRRESWTPPDSFAFGEAELKPLRSGEALPWRLEVGMQLSTPSKISSETKGPAPTFVTQSAPPTQPSADETAIARKILGAVGLWRPHTIKQLNQLGTPLRESGIKSGNAPLHQLFRKCPAFFTVLPLKGAPKQVRLERSL